LGFNAPTISDLPPTMPPTLTAFGEGENLTMKKKSLKALILQGFYEG